jgi:hypothetical protein
MIHAGQPAAGDAAADAGDSVKVAAGGTPRKAVPPEAVKAGGGLLLTPEQEEQRKHQQQLMYAASGARNYGFGAEFMMHTYKVRAAAERVYHVLLGLTGVRPELTGALVAARACLLPNTDSTNHPAGGGVQAAGQAPARQLPLCPPRRRGPAAAAAHLPGPAVPRSQGGEHGCWLLGDVAAVSVTRLGWRCVSARSAPCPESLPPRALPCLGSVSCRRRCAPAWTTASAATGGWGSG